MLIIQVSPVPGSTVGHSKQETTPVHHEIRKALDILVEQDHTSKVFPGVCMFIHSKGVVCNY